MMLSTSFHGGRKIYILARDLVEAGATPTKLVLTKAVLSSDINLLQVCLRRGETPNRIGLLLAVLTAIETEESSLVKFMLGERKRADRKTSDVFEGTSIAAAAMSGDSDLLGLLLGSLPSAKFCAVSPSIKFSPSLKADNFNVSRIIKETTIDAFFLPGALKCYSPLILPVIADRTDVVMLMMSHNSYYQPDMACLLCAIANHAPHWWRLSSLGPVSLLRGQRMSHCPMALYTLLCSRDRGKSFSFFSESASPGSSTTQRLHFARPFGSERAPWLTCC